MTTTKISYIKFSFVNLNSILVFIFGYLFNGGCKGNQDTTVTKILEKTIHQRSVLSYIHLKRIVFSSNNIYFAQKFLHDVIQ